MPTARIEKIKEMRVPKFFSGNEFVKPVYLSILRSRAYTEVWKETEGEPLPIRRAKAFARYLDTVPIFIRPHTLIVGFYAEDPGAFPVCLEYMDPNLIKSYIGAGLVKEEEITEWHQYLDYWDKRNSDPYFRNLLTPEEDKLSRSNRRYMEVLSGRMSSRTQADSDLYLDISLNKIIEMLHQKLDVLYKEKDRCVDGPEGIEIVLKINDVKAMLISAEACLRWTSRYSQLAKTMAEEEKDPVRKEELLQLSEICSWVPGNPPRSFWEALQSHWFTFLAYQAMEELCQGTGIRLDQVFWPWYEKDVLINKTLSREKALELVENFLLLVDELGQPRGLESRRSLQGGNMLSTYTIGGVKPEDGSDACNELTLLILDAYDDLRLNHPDTKFRWHPKVNPKVWRRVVEVIRSGLGHPAVVNDLVGIPCLMEHDGFTLEEARSLATIGCLAQGVTLRWGACRRNVFSVNIAKYLELALNNGVDPVPLDIERDYMGMVIKGQDKKQQVGPRTGDAATFTTFEEVFEAFRRQVAYFYQKAAHIKTLGEYVNTMFLKRPFASCFFHRSLDACRDVMDAPTKPSAQVNNVGMVDAADSLISLKKLVFVDKKYTIEEVVKALNANWEGYEEMRRDFINAPKIGNDDDFADEVAKQTYAMIVEELSKVTEIHGIRFMAGTLPLTYIFSLAPHVGALPNGRKRGDYLADGGISPYAGYDKSGPMAAVLSGSNIVDSLKWRNNIFNQKLTPSSVKGEAGLRKFQNYIETAMHLGLQEIQFNIVDAATLREAQKHPEQYKDLVVRVSGYNARFNDLNEFVQEAIIERTEHALV
jgi:pyruvate-formate lyase